MHSSENVLFRRLTHRVLLIVCQYHHVFSLVAEMPVQVRGHVLYVVYAASKLSSLTEVVDADEKCLSSTGAIGILECVPVRCAMSKIL